MKDCSSSSGVNMYTIDNNKIIDDPAATVATMTTTSSSSSGEQKEDPHYHSYNYNYNYNNNSMMYENLRSPTSLQDYVVSMISSKGVHVELKSFDSVRDYFYNTTKEEFESYQLDVVAAVRNDDLEAIQAFHKEGRLLSCRNHFGHSLLHLACRRGLLEIAYFLIYEAKVPIQIRDDDGKTPLHDAFWTVNPNLEIIDLLINICPALLFVCDRRGHTPLSYSREENWGSWKAYFRLKIAGAFQPSKSTKKVKKHYYSLTGDSSLMINELQLSFNLPPPAPRRRLPHLPDNQTIIGTIWKLLALLFFVIMLFYFTIFP